MQKENDVLTEKIKKILNSTDKTSDSQELSDQDINNCLQISELIIGYLNKNNSHKEHSIKNLLNEISTNNNTKSFVLQFLDQCFRSKTINKINYQIIKLLNNYDVPTSFHLIHRIFFLFFRLFSKFLPSISAKLAHYIFKKEFYFLFQSMDEIAYLNNNNNINVISTAYDLTYVVNGNNEIKNNLKNIFFYITKKNVDCVYVNPALLLTQFDLIDKEYCIKQLQESFIKILIEAQRNNKFIYIGASYYSFFSIMIQSIKNFLSNDSLKKISFGIIIQTYLPDSFNQVKEIIELIKKSNRTIKNRTIKICIVKGGFLTKEQTIAAKKYWKQATFTSKIKTDANFKKILKEVVQEQNKSFLQVSIGTNNTFDIAYALILAKKNNFSTHLSFEILDTFNDRLIKCLQKISLNKVNVYFPILTKRNFNVVAPQLIRNLEEIIQKDCFFHQIKKLKPNTSIYKQQQAIFLDSIKEIDSISTTSRRLQNTPFAYLFSFFENEKAFDFSAFINNDYLNRITKRYLKDFETCQIPYVINKKVCFNKEGTSSSPNAPVNYYYYSKAGIEVLETSLQITNLEWLNTGFFEKRDIFFNILNLLKENKEQLISALIFDVAKNFQQADYEISQSIDIIEYYLSRMYRMLQMSDLIFSPKKGFFIITNYDANPCFSAINDITAALVTNNKVIFTPSSNCMFISWLIVNILWDSGIPKDILQFAYIDTDVLEQILKNKEIGSLIFYGSFKNYKKYRKINPNLNIVFFTKGKNVIVVSSNSDKELTIKHIVASSLSFSSQKYSSASLLILEKEIYEDKEFIKNLIDAVSSLHIGLSWEVKSFITPLINPIDDKLNKTIQHLEKGEEWLLKPVQDNNNPNLWSCGIKKNVKKQSAFFNKIFSFPIIGLMKANNINHAIDLANSNKYLLAAAFFTLDDVEKITWLSKIHSCNYFVNNKITDPMVRKQPFGFSKQLFFNSYQIGGPNFLYNFVDIEQKGIPKEKNVVNKKVNELTPFLEKINLTTEQLGIWYVSIANYAYWWGRIKHYKDNTKILGQDNIFGYIPINQIYIYIDAETSVFDALRACAACITCGAKICIVLEQNAFSSINWEKLSFCLIVQKESKRSFIKKLKNGNFANKRIRLTHKADIEIKKSAIEGFAVIIDSPILSNGRIELINYLKEISFSCDYDRYGNLGIRNAEFRKPLN